MFQLKCMCSEVWQYAHLILYYNLNSTCSVSLPISVVCWLETTKWLENYILSEIVMLISLRVDSIHVYINRFEHTMCLAH